MINKNFKETVELFGKHVSDHVKIIEPSFFKVPLLFRVDEVVPKTFIARMPKSAANTENSTVPRVVTASTLLGCMCGHAGVIYYALNRDAGEPCANNYQISAFEFDYALLPDSTLVFDALYNQEAWLVTYDKATIAYKPTHYGEIFIHKINTIMMGNSKVNKVIADMLLKVEDSRGLPLAGNLTLPKGHYYLKIDVTNYAADLVKGNVKRMGFKDSDKIDVTTISESIYKSFREMSVSKVKG